MRGFDVGGDFVEAGHLGCSVAAFASDDQVAAVVFFLEDDGLDDAVGADGFGELLECFFFKDGAWLVRVGLDAAEFDFVDGR